MDHNLIAFKQMHKCTGDIVCNTCKLTDCTCEEITCYSCNKCPHKMCNWCGNTTYKRNTEECVECFDWDYIEDVCESDFCVNYLGGHGHINYELVCDQCRSISPMIRVPLAFHLQLYQILLEYPDFESINKCFLKYYSYSHTNCTWEPYTNLEFILAQKYFNFDAGIIVLGRTKKEETLSKSRDAIKIDKELRKAMKKERRLLRLKNLNKSI